MSCYRCRLERWGLPRHVHRLPGNGPGNAAHTPIYGAPQLDLCYDRQNNAKQAWLTSALRESPAPMLVFATVQLEQAIGPKFYSRGRIAL
jgi:hypothetical protein